MTSTTVASSASVFTSLLASSCLTANSYSSRCRLKTIISQSQSHITTDGQWVSKSWCRAPSGPHDQIFITVWQLRSCFMWGALSGERMGLSFVYATGPCQRSLSQVRVPWDSRPYFTVSELRLPFSSPPTTRRLTVEVFVPSSTASPAHYIALAWTTQKTPLPTVHLLLHHVAIALTTQRTPFFCCCLCPLPSTGCSLQSHYLATGVHATL
jgi:hypothetical protein